MTLRFEKIWIEHIFRYQNQLHTDYKIHTINILNYMDTI